MKNKIPDTIIGEIFPKKVKRSLLSEEVYDQLKKMILSGKFKKGQRLVEEKLAHRLNVSRNPVQIALLRLREENFVVWKYKRGTFVA
ncbi:MAG TPA: GntR family transcriptional regulator [Thermodesulfobacteriota bacterium]|jgi:DNA-binding GntR family transcriptional regulator|nr:GntR family transcriptional regulator [Thermodesulfobacteriota bacterium]